MIGILSFDQNFDQDLNYDHDHKIFTLITKLFHLFDQQNENFISIFHLFYKNIKKMIRSDPRILFLY